MLSMFLGKKILSGTVCLATATTSIGMTTSCGKNTNSNSVSVS
jgi:branched-subunit amino acid permease